MALPAPTKVYDFTANAALGLAVPGDRVDAQFLNHKNAIAATQTALALIQRDDGTLKAGVVGPDQLSEAALTAISASVDASVAEQLDTLSTSVGQAQTYASTSGNNAATATSAATQATNAANAISTASGSALASINTANANATQLLGVIANAEDDIDNALNDIDNAIAEADLAAALAQGWAEHMPGPLPPDLLAQFSITGEHWSARWWANQADLIVGAVPDFVERYLGAHATAPTADDNGNPLTAGALYFDMTTEAMRVYTGTIWRTVTNDFVAASATVSTNRIVDTSGWVFNGTTTAFLTKDLGGVNIPLVSAGGCIVVLDGVIQDPASFSVSGSTLTFASAPPAGTTSFAIAGVELGGTGGGVLTVVSHNTTLTGDGTSGSPLGVNTTAILTVANAASTYATIASLSNIDIDAGTF